MECRGEGIYSRQMEEDRGEEIVLHPPITPFLTQFWFLSAMTVYDDKYDDVMPSLSSAHS